MNRKKAILCLFAILVLALNSEPATARVRTHKAKKIKAPFSPSTEDFSGSKKIFSGSRKAFKVEADEFKSSGNDLSSSADFKPSAGELIDSKYKVFTPDKRYVVWSRRHHHSLSRKFALSESMGASGSFGSESFAFSPSTDEFEVPKRKKRIGRYFK